jgi:hypothetical protein
VSDLHQNLSQTIDLCGPAVLVGENVVPRICNQLLSVITKKHPCQQDPEEGDDDGQVELEESSEYDWLVVETAMDCVMAIAKALGPDFAELWKVFSKPILKYASSSDSNERAVSTGTMAECILAMKTSVGPYTQQLMKIALHRFSDEDTVTKANNIYAAGLLCQFSPDENFIRKQYSAILGKLAPLLQDSSSTGHLLDNAAGCVARMILAHPTDIPLAEVLPHLVKLAPAKEDSEVNGPLFQCFVRLCKCLCPVVAAMAFRMLTGSQTRRTTRIFRG